MTAVVLKFVLTPGLIALATLCQRRWGPAVGGALAGLPLTSVPLSVFLALEQGPAFAAAAAVGTLLGMLSQAALCLAYAWTARTAGWALSAVAGVAAFLAVTLLLGPLAVSPWPAFALVCALLLAAGTAMPPARPAAARARPPAWDLPARMLVAMGVVVGLSAAAAALGPRWTGLLSPFPVFALVLGGFTHRTEGPAAAAGVLRGVVAGSLSQATTFALVAHLLPAHGLLVTYASASVVALAVNACVVARAAAPR